MNPPVVVGVDGSQDALKAVDWATDEACRRGLPLRIVHASRWAYYEGLSSSRAPAATWEAERIAAEAEQRARLRSPEVPVRSDVSAEDPSDYLVSASSWASTIVVGSRGHGGLAGLLLGSVSLTVAARAQCPVTVVRGDVSAVDGDWVVAGLGGPATSPGALDHAFEEAHLLGLGVVVVHAWMCPRHESATAHTGQFEESRTVRQREARQWLGEATAGPVSRHPDVPVRRVEAEGPARNVLLEASRQATMLVVGARHRESGLGMQLGPVCHAVLHHANCTVTVVPQEKGRPPEEEAPQESLVEWGGGNRPPVFTPVPGK